MNEGNHERIREALDLLKARAGFHIHRTQRGMERLLRE
jgi:hypothetical protein